MTTITKRKITVPNATTATPPAPKAKLVSSKSGVSLEKTAAARPSVPLHKLNSTYTGTSDVYNTRASRTAIDYSKFGSLPDAPTTERDRAGYNALREQFGTKVFQRANVDAGVLRRLGERGFIAHVAGATNEATATFRLTTKKLAA